MTKPKLSVAIKNDSKPMPELRPTTDKSREAKAEASRAKAWFCEEKLKVIAGFAPNPEGSNASNVGWRISLRILVLKIRGTYLPLPSHWRSSETSVNDRLNFLDRSVKLSELKVKKFQRSVVFVVRPPGATVSAVAPARRR